VSDKALNWLGVRVYKGGEVFVYRWANSEVSGEFHGEAERTKALKYQSVGKFNAGVMVGWRRCGVRGVATPKTESPLQVCIDLGNFYPKSFTSQI
jgi:hypothetical protein